MRRIIGAERNGITNPGAAIPIGGPRRMSAVSGNSTVVVETFEIWARMRLTVTTGGSYPVCRCIATSTAVRTGGCSAGVTKRWVLRRRTCVRNDVN